MPPRHWLIAIILLATFWLAGWIVCVPGIESALEEAAHEALAAREDARHWRDVGVTFIGQEAVLGGKVSKPEHRDEALRVVRDSVRLAGSGLNPVTDVSDEIEVVPLPPGWAMLSLAGDKVTLLGIAGSEPETTAITDEVHRLFARPGMAFQSALHVDEERAADAATLDVTLQSLPLKLKSAERDGAVFVARLGEEWRSFHPAAAGTLEEALMACGATKDEWTREISPVVAAAATRRATLAQKAEERERHSRLPAPHVILCINGTRVLLRGEVGTAAAKTALIEAAVKNYGSLQIIDELRVSAARRPDVDATSALENLPALDAEGGTRLAAVSVSGGEWRMAKLTADENRAALLATLPDGFDVKLAGADAEAASKWLGVPKAVPLGDPRMQPHLALAVFSDRVWLRGEVAQESERSQILAAARRSYPNHLLVQFVRLNARCRPVEQVLHTTGSFPIAPDKAAPGLIAFVVPGDIWQAADVTPDVLAPDGLAKAGIVDEEFPVELAREEFSEALDAVAAHLKEINRTPAK